MKSRWGFGWGRGLTHIDGAICSRRQEHRRGLSIRRCAGMASARVSPVATLVFVGLEQGRRAGRVHQSRNPTPFPDAEIPKPLMGRGLEQCAANSRRMDAVPVRWRAALVCVFGRCKRSVLRSPGHQAVRSRTPVRLPPLLSACLR